MSNILPHWLTKRATLSPEQVAIELEKGEKITFLAFQKRSEAFARKLATYGVKKGDHLAIYSKNCIEMIIAVYAISYLGAVCVLLNHRLTEHELIYQIKDADVQMILTCQKLQSTSQAMNLPVPVVSFSEINELPETNQSLLHEMDLDAPFTMMYTSGTTGKPKAVIQTYGNHFWSATGSVLNMGLHSDDKWLSVLPMFHIGGLSIFFRSVIYGIPVLLHEEFDAGCVNEAVQRKNVTILSAVTVMLQEIIATLGEKKYPETFRTLLLGGGAVPEELIHQAFDKGIPVFQTYGLTETCSQIATLSPEDSFRKIGSAGKPLFPGELKIVSNGDEKIGEIYVKGPMVAKGYYKREKDRFFLDGWLRTGDLGYVDEEGFLYIVDRRTDLIISGGENIYPTEIEHLLLEMEGIQDVGVTGRSHEKWGEVPVAFIVRSDQTLTEKEVFSYLEKRLAPFKRPHKIYFVKKLPRNATGKLMRYQLRKLIKGEDSDGFQA